VNGNGPLLDVVQPRAQSALSGSPIFELRNLQIETLDETLVLYGCVSSFYHKQLAQEVVCAVCRDTGFDVRDVQVVNSIRVR